MGQPSAAGAKADPARGTPDQKTFADLDRIVLERAGLKTDAPSLEAYLVGLAGDDKELLQLPKLIAGLDDDRFRLREESAKRIKALGLAAVPTLERAAAKVPADRAPHVKKCLEAIHEAAQLHVAAAAVRELGEQLKPTGVAALLRYLPYAGEDRRAAILELLLSAARRPGGADALVPALIDPVPARRAAAAGVLGALGDQRRVEQVAPLLRDPEALVRLRAAEGLLAGGDLRGVSALIGLVTESDLMVRYQAVALLDWLAEGDAAAPPVRPPAEVGAERQQEAWQAWWAARQGAADLLRRERRTVPALTFVVFEGGRKWAVELLTGRGRVVWKLDYPDEIYAARMSAEGLVYLSQGVGTGLWLFADAPEPAKRPGVYLPRGGLTRLATGTVVATDYDGPRSFDMAPFGEDRRSFGTGLEVAQLFGREIGFVSHSACDETGLCVRRVGRGKEPSARFRFHLYRDPTVLLTVQVGEEPPSRFVTNPPIGLEGFLHGPLQAQGGSLTWVEDMDRILWVGRSIRRVKVPGQVRVARVVGHRPDSLLGVAHVDGRLTCLVRLSPDGKVLAEQVLVASGTERWPISVQPVVRELDLGWSRYYGANDLASPEAYFRLLASGDTEAARRAVLGLRGLADARPASHDRRWVAGAVKKVLPLLSRQERPRGRHG